MRRLALIVSLILLTVMPLAAQVTGCVLEDETQQPIAQAAVQLLSPKDSSQVAGTVTDEEGIFSLSAAKGNYIACFTYIGMTTRYVPVRVPESGSIDLDRIYLSADAIWLDQAVVTASVPLTTMSADTVVYNPAALIIAEDATLDDILKKIPGMEVDEHGNVTLHGREVTKLLVNGKEFFGGDVASGLKNIPAEMIENIKAYDRESDLKRLTGVDDGEEETALDVKIKPAFLTGWTNRLTAGAGPTARRSELFDLSRWRYTGRLNSTRLTDSSQVAVVVNASNIPYPNPFNSKSNQMGTGTAGDAHKVEAGLTFSHSKKTLEMGGSVHYDCNIRDASTSIRTENIYSTGNTFTIGEGSSNGMKHNFKADGNFEFKPRKGLSFLFRPVVTFSRNDNFTITDNANYQDDWSVEANRVYNSINRTRNLQDRLNANVTFQAYKRLSDKGRSISARIYLEYQNNDEEVLADNSTKYYRIKSNPDSTRIYKRFNDTGTNSLSTWLQLTYSEPLAKGMSLQIMNRAQYKLSLTDKDCYRLESCFADWAVAGRRGSVRSMLPDGYENTFEASQSCLGRYDYFADYITVNYRLSRKKFNLTAGVVVVPQVARTSYPGKAEGDTTTFTITAAPNLSLKWNKSKQEHLSVSYKSYAQAPSANYLLNVPYGNNPQYTRLGNPGLKPSFTHNARLSYDLGRREKQSSLILDAAFKLIQNAISLSTSYDTATGKKVAMPLNVQGNWNANASLVLNRTFGNSGFSLSSNTKFDYDNNVGYLYDSKKKIDNRNVTRRAMGIERLNGTYRNNWLELTLNLSGLYTIERSEYRPAMNQSPWALSAGLNTIFRMPWKMTFTSEFTEWSQRGYVYDELNKDYFLWDARLSQSCLKGKLVFTLLWHDILRQQENLVRSFNADRRSITVENNAARSYLLFRVSWRF